MVRGDNALKKVIKQQNISITELAKRCEISSGYLSLIVNGKRNNISAKILVKISKELNLSINEVLDLISNKDIPSINSQIFQMTNAQLERILNALEINDNKTIEECTKKLESKSDVIAVKYMQWYKGWKLTLQNQFDDAINCFKRSLVLKPRGSIERRFMAKVLSSLGGAYVAKSNYRLAIDCFRKSILLWNEGQQVSIVYLNLGTLYRRTYKLQNAKNNYLKALEIGPIFIKIMAVSSIIQLAFDCNEMDEAKKYVVMAYWLSKKTQDPLGKDDLFCNIGIYYFLKRKCKKAQWWLNKAISLCNYTKNIRTKHCAMVELANLYFYEGNYKLGDEILNQLIGKNSYNSDNSILGNILCISAKRSLILKDVNQALLILKKCYSFLINFPPSKEMKVCCELLSSCFKLNGDLYIAEFYSNEAHTIKNKIKKYTR